MKVVLLPSNIDGSGCYRCLLPGRELRMQRGWDARMAPHRIRAGKAHEFGGGRHLLVEYGVHKDPAVPIDTWLLQKDFDVLLWQQRPERWTAALTGMLQAQGKRVYVDSDDAWWGLPKWNPGSRRPKDQIRYMRQQIQAADGLSVATPALADMYGHLNSNVRVIRNRLDWHMWEDTIPVYQQHRRRVRVGWLGEVAWRAGDLEVLRPWLGQWLAAHPDVEFCAAADPRVHDILGIPEQQRVTTNRVEFYNFDLADIVATFDIGLVPLDLSTPEARTLNECKSHLKAMEYGACGIPCIATPTESYLKWWVDPGVNGMLCDTPGSWSGALDFLIANDDDRRRMGQNARRKAEQHTLQQHIGEWEDWLAGNSSPHPQPPRPAAALTAGVAVS